MQTMHLLLLHPNYPGQFKLLARALRQREGWRVTAVGAGERSAEEREGVSYHPYGQPTGPSELHFPAVQGIGDHARRGRSAADLVERLSSRGVRPDVVLAHPGWGDAMFLPQVLPQARLVAYLEYFYRARGSDIDFDPEFPVTGGDPRYVPLRNATNLLAFAAADRCITPTRFQAGLFPPAIRQHLTVLHEGIDTEEVCPQPGAAVRLPGGRVLTAADEVVTYMSRSLEPYRGFHVFMRALPELLRLRPRAQVVVVGRDDVSYGRPPAGGGTWKDALLREVGADLDLTRVHFLGAVPFDTYLSLLRVSTVHVYLTYPFVLSWSFLEAMACGCTIVGSATGPVLEVLEDGVNGRAVGFFDRAALVERIGELLDDPAQRARLSAGARATAVEVYDFGTRTFPAYLELLRG